MKFRQIVIPLAMAFWAATSSAQAPSWEQENAAGMQAYRKQSYTEAENLLKDAFRQAEQFGEFDPRLAGVMSNLAAVQQAKGKFAEAELLYNRALTICEKVDGPEQLEVATSLDDIANLLAVEQGQHDAVVERAVDNRDMPGRRPAPVMLSPASRTAKVAAGLVTSSSLKSSGVSR